MEPIVYSGMRTPAHVGGAIKNARKRLGLAQADLADASGVSLRTLTRIENGHGSTGIETVLAVLRALQLNLVFYPAPQINVGVYASETA